MENLKKLGQASDTVLRVMEVVSPGPRKACLILAMTLGRLAERCGMSLDLLTTVMADSARASVEVASNEPKTRWRPIEGSTT